MSDVYESLKELAPTLSWPDFVQACARGFRRLKERAEEQPLGDLKFRLLVVQQMLTQTERGYLVLPPLQRGGRGLVVLRPDRAHHTPNLVRIWSERFGMHVGSWDWVVTR